MKAAAAILLLSFTCVGCASVPGKNGAAQQEEMTKLVDKTLADLYQQNPATKAEIAQSVGYVVMNKKLTKIPAVGVGAGYGVGIETATGARTYLQMRRFDIGAGWGARGVRSVVVFRALKPFQDFINGDFDVTLGAEAAAKVGDAGAAGGGETAKPGAKDVGYSTYLITDAGVSATATFALIRVKPIKLKK